MSPFPRFDQKSKKPKEELPQLTLPKSKTEFNPNTKFTNIGIQNLEINEEKDFLKK